MVIDRERFMVLAFAIAACQPLVNERVATPPVPPAIPIATAAAASPVAPALSMCAEVARSNAAILSSPTGDCAELATGLPIEEVRKQLLHVSRDPFFQYCHEGHGTWAVVVAGAVLSESYLEGGPSCGSAISYQLVFISKTGERVTSPTRTWTMLADSSTKAVVEAAFDFDGVGRDELVISHHRSSQSFGGDSSVAALRATSVVEPYPVGYPIEAMTDADKDGRPDFIAPFFVTSSPCVGLYETFVSGVPLLVHSLADGTFTMSDETARRWARRECPVAPSKKIPSSDPEVASCKRLWGQSVADITRGLPTEPDFCGDPKSSAKGLTNALVSPVPPFATLDRKTPAPLPPRPTREPEGAP